MLRLSVSSQIVGRRLVSLATHSNRFHQHIKVRTVKPIRTYLAAHSSYHYDLAQLTGSFKQSFSTCLVTATAPRNNLPRCAGKTATNARCQRDGIRPDKSDPNKHYCYQHDPTLVTSHRCLANVQNENRRCLIICSESEIRPGGRPICNTHFRPGGKDISR